MPADDTDGGNLEFCRLTIDIECTSGCNNGEVRIPDRVRTGTSSHNGIVQSAHKQVLLRKI